MGLPSILPKDDPEENFIGWYGKVNMFAIPTAMLVSYARNRDLKWALIHGALGTPYLLYLMAETVSRLEGEAIVKAAHEVDHLTAPEIETA